MGTVPWRKSVSDTPMVPCFHYSIERFREALLWSFVMKTADANGDGYLDWSERQAVLEAIKSGRHAVGGGDSSTPATTAAQRERMYYQLPKILKQAGLQTPQSNPNVLWTSLDGPKQSATSNATTSESTNASPSPSTHPYQTCRIRTPTSARQISSRSSRVASRSAGTA